MNEESYNAWKFHANPYSMKDKMGKLEQPLGSTSKANVEDGEATNLGTS